MKPKVFVVLVGVNLTLLVVGIALPHWWEMEGHLSDDLRPDAVIHMHAYFGLWRYCYTTRGEEHARWHKCDDPIRAFGWFDFERRIEAVTGLTLAVAGLHILSVLVFATSYYGESQRERVKVTAVMNVLAVLAGCTILGMASHMHDMIEDEFSWVSDLHVTFGDSFILATTATVFNGLLAAALLFFLRRLKRLGAYRGQPLGDYPADDEVELGGGPLAAYGEEGSVQSEVPGAVR